MSVYKEENGKVIVTLYGHECECMPEFGFVIQAGSGIPMPPEPQPPTYTIHALGGVTEDRPHTATSIKDPKTSDEEKAQWADYLMAFDAHEIAVAEVKRKRNRAQINAIIDRAIVLRDIPASGDLSKWADRQMDRYGIAVERETEDDLVLSWIHLNVIRVPNDAYKLIMGIAAASGLGREVLSQVEGMFLDSLGRRKGTDASADQNTPGGDQ